MGLENAVTTLRVERSNYSEYLAEYYNQNAYELQLDPAVVYKRCLKMEEELVSMWKTKVPRHQAVVFSISTIIQSSLIKQCALAICGTTGNFSDTSAISFMCITKEAELMCEMLKHGAEPIDDIIEQSSVIRMCALGLLKLDGQQSIVFAAAMVGMAKQAERLSNFVKRENKLPTSVLGGELDVRAIQNRTLDVVIRTKTLDLKRRPLL